MSRSADRAAKNEELFREVNRNIARLEERFGRTQTLELICECEGVGCHDGLEIDSVAYADARSNSLRFFVLPGHEDPQIEQVVLRTPTYLVVEKVGEAAREILDEDSGGQQPEQ
jgi:hypothetical protein